nr:MAG TPA: hypothetical protein [Caudoviricetes sp.]
MLLCHFRKIIPEKIRFPLKTKQSNSSLLIVLFCYFACIMFRLHGSGY